MLNSTVLLLYNIYSNRKDPDPDMSVLWLIIFFIDVLNILIILWINSLLT